MTHSELVDIAYRYLLKHMSCGYAVKECKSAGTDEIPDVLGFGGCWHSVMIEVKVSKQDFLKDKFKPWRINERSGVGVYRLYCCPEGLILPEEIPQGWGLMYVSDSGRIRMAHTGYVDGTMPLKDLKKHECNIKAEWAKLYSALLKSKKNIK